MTITTLYDHPVYPVKQVDREDGRTFYVHCWNDTQFRVFDSEDKLNKLLQEGIDESIASVGTWDEAIAIIEPIIKE